MLRAVSLGKPERNSTLITSQQVWLTWKRTRQRGEKKCPHGASRTFNPPLALLLAATLASCCKHFWGILVPAHPEIWLDTPRQKGGATWRFIASLYWFIIFSFIDLLLLCFYLFLYQYEYLFISPIYFTLFRILCCTLFYFSLFIFYHLYLFFVVSIFVSYALLHLLLNKKLWD